MRAPDILTPSTGGSGIAPAAGLAAGSAAAAVDSGSVALSDGGLVLRGIRRFFGDVVALDGVDLAVTRGESLVVLGPSGSGKSTLLRIIAGLDHADEGEVLIGGRDQIGLPPHRRDVAIVFQHFALYPHLTALRNITLGLRHGLRLDPAAADRRARDVAGRLQITELLDRLPRQLSGGQRQRVALARALARQAGVVLLDEPLSGLDAQLRQSLRIEIAGRLRSAGATTVHVTHDQIDAMATADRIAVLRDGRLEQVGTPDELYHRPRTAFVAGFIGSPPMNLMPADHTHDGWRTPLGLVHHPDLPGRPAAGGGGVTVGVRPEHLRVSGPNPEASDGPWRNGDGETSGTGTEAQVFAPAVVSLVVPAGPEKIVHLDAAGTAMAARCAADVPLRPGAEVTLTASVADLHLFL